MKQHISTPTGSALLVVSLLISLFLIFSSANQPDVPISYQTIISHTQLAQISGAGSGLVAHYTFDEGSGTTAGDTSGNNNTGTLAPSTNGPTWNTTDKRIGNSALQFDGVNDYVNAGTSASLNLTGAFTVSAWVKTVSATTYSTIVARGTVGGTPLSEQYYLSFNADTAPRFSMSNGTTRIVSTGRANSAPNGVWNHIVGTYNGTDTTRLYVNGVQVDTDTTAGFGSLNSTVFGVGVGAIQSGAAGRLNGSLDDVRIYNRALSVNEIGELYALGGGVVPPPAAVNGSCGSAAKTYTSVESFLTSYCSSGTATPSSPTDPIAGSSSNWSCAGSNGGTTASCTATRALPGGDTTPPTITSGPTVSNITANSATVSWTTNETADTQIQYGPTIGYTSNTSVIDTSPRVTSHTQSITGLTANTTYNYRVISTDAAGNTIRSNNATFVTTAAQTTGITPTAGNITYYVSPSGNDTNLGTQASPLKTIQKCADVARAGNTCLVQAGTYPEHVTTKFGGTDNSNRITFKANGTVIMQGFGIYFPYVTVDGFDITGFTPSLAYEHIDITIGGNNCEIINNVIRDGAVGVGGINFVTDPTTLQSADNCLISGNTLKNLNSVFLTIKGGNHIVENNVFERLNNRDYIFLFGHDSIFRRNIFREGNAVAGVGNHPDLMQTFPDTAGRGESRNMLFEENWIENIDAQFSQLNSGAGGKSVYPSPNFRDWTFRRNAFVNISAYAGIGIAGVKFENNTFYKMSYTSGGITYSGSLGRGDASYGLLKNNVFLEGGSRSTVVNDLSGYYGINIGFAKEALRLFVTLEDWPFSLTECVAAPIACGIFEDLKIGYVNSAGFVTNKFSVVSQASDLALPDAYIPYRDQIFSHLKAAQTNNSAVTISSILTFVPGTLTPSLLSELQRGYVDNNGILLVKAKALTNISQFVLSNTYASYKQSTYDHLVMTKDLDKSFLADYNYVAGAQSAGYPRKSSVCNAGASYTAFNFCEPHGINGGDPRLANISDPDGPDNVPFTLDDGLKPISGSPLCGAGEGGTDIGVYSCAANVVFAGGSGTPAVRVNGSCGTNVNICTSGFLSDSADTSSDNVWQCLGSNGGTTASCSLPKTVVVEPPSSDLPCAIAPRAIRAYSVIDGNAIRLEWPANEYRQELKISRRVYSHRPSAWQNWTEIYTVTDPVAVKQASSYRDTNVTSGVHYEYRITVLNASWTCGSTTHRPTWSYQHISTGTVVPLKDVRGKLILLVESGLTTPLSAEITRLENDLIGDGYQIYRHDVPASEVTSLGWKTAVANTKALVRGDYNTDASADWTLFIVGHVPIPYSGLYSPGSHTENLGAHPADWYYADIDEAGWTDTTVNNITADYVNNRNIPGDGKFDQNQTPSTPEMRVGRIDLRNMPAFGKTEVELLRQYLDREHSWRHKQFTVRDRALVNANNNNLLIYEGFPFESHSNYSSFFGTTANTDLGSWLDDARTPATSYLFAASAGNGQLTEDMQIGSTAEFAANPLHIVFTSMYGSYYGDWDSAMHPNIVLLAPLAARGYVVSNYYREVIMNMDSTSMGEPIGQELFAMGSNSFPAIAKRYFSYGYIFEGQTYENTARLNNYNTLMGDPTLKARIVAPPTNVGIVVNGADNVISWTAASDTNIQGYHVYRAPTTNLNNFTRLTNTPTTARSFTDTGAASGSYRYMVRTVKLEQSANRSYYNASQGIFAAGNVVTPPSTDRDEDGIPNAADLCPNTPPDLRTVVNQFGCPKPRVNNFSIRPDFNTLDLRSISNLELGNPTYGKVIFTQPVSLIRTVGDYEDQIDVDGSVAFSQNRIAINSTATPELNKPAVVYLYNVTLTTPKIFKDGVACTTCTITEHNKTARTLTFTVPGFSTYEAGESSVTTVTVPPLPVPTGNISGSRARDITNLLAPGVGTLSPLTVNLYRGIIHPEVKILQIFLNLSNYIVTLTGTGSRGQESTTFGPATEAALKRFQCDKGITCTGTPDTTGYGRVGPKTRGIINSQLGGTIPPVSQPSSPSSVLPASSSFTRTLSQGMTGNDVKALQVYLNSKGFTVATTGGGSPGNETTFFGPATKAALIRFQEANRETILTPNGLTNGTGVFGPSTRASIR